MRVRARLISKAESIWTDQGAAHHGRSDHGPDLLMGACLWNRVLVLWAAVIAGEWRWDDAGRRLAVRQRAEASSGHVGVITVGNLISVELGSAAKQR